jgi:hypothetical protein
MKREAGVLALLALVPAILFGDILFGGKTLYVRDVATYHYPGKKVLRTIVMGGEFPYWSPYISAGQPVAANPIHQVFYPPTWLILLPDFTTGFNLLALLHVYIATFGMYALLRSMRVRRAAAAFGAISFGCGGMLVSMLNLFPLLYSAAWMPVIALFTRRFLITRGRRDFALASLAFAMQLLIGEPVTALQTGILLGAYAIHRRRPARNVGAVACVVLTALLLSSVQTIPAFDHLRDSGRGSGIGFAEVTEWSTPPLRLLEPLFPAILGRWSMGAEPIYASANLFGTHAQPLFFGISCGLGVGVLALAGLLARMRGAVLFAILATVSAILAFGSYTPLFQLLHDAGLLRFIRFPEKFLVMGTFAAVVFAACALERLLDNESALGGRPSAVDSAARRLPTADSLRRAAMIVAACVALAGLVAAAASFAPAYESLLRRLYAIGPHDEIFDMVAVSREGWIVAAIRAALLVLLLAAMTHIRRPLWLALLAAFVLADLAPQVRELAPRMPRAYFDEEPPTARRLPRNRDEFRIFPRADWVRGSEGAPSAAIPDQVQAWRRRSELPAQMPGAYGLRTVMDIDIDVSDLRAEKDFVTSVIDLMKDRQRPRDWIDIVGAMSNAWFVSGYRRPGDPAAVQEPVAFRERTHDPRYYFASELVTIRDRAEFVRALRDRRFSRRVAFVHEPAFAPAAGRVLAQRESANAARIDVEADGRAFLVMSVTPHKYWRVRVDGAEVPAVRTNIGYQGVVVPPGRHAVEMRYRNPLVAVGGAVSGMGLLLLVLVLSSRRLPCPFTRRK